MKKILTALVFAFMVNAGYADSQAPIQVGYSTQTLRTVFVWALGNDAGNINDVELDIQQELIKRGVASERASKVFPQGMTGPANQILPQMRSSGCDSVLVVRRTSTIHWESEDSDTASLHSLIVHRSQLLDPKDALQANAAKPIVVSNATGTGSWEIVQGEAMVFDLKSGAFLWRGSTAIKSAKDLPQKKYLQVVAQKVAHELETAGLVPPIKSKAP